MAIFLPFYYLVVICPIFSVSFSCFWVAFLFCFSLLLALIVRHCFLIFLVVNLEIILYIFDLLRCDLSCACTTSQVRTFPVILLTASQLTSYSCYYFNSLCILNLMKLFFINLQLIVLLFFLLSCVSGHPPVIVFPSNWRTLEYFHSHICQWWVHFVFIWKKIFILPAFFERHFCWI